MAQEWDAHRVQVLRTDYNESLAAAIELSLTSPMFHQLGPNARDLLGVIAFFPQGINEKNLNWLFPTIPDRRTIFDKFCVLSLTYRNSGSITMLAPLRDYLRPKDPTSSPLLLATKKQYFDRLSVVLDVNGPSFKEARWIVLEDVNVEHLLDVFTTVDATSTDVWYACSNFMGYLHAHKPRLVMLRPNIEGLPDDHSSKPDCLLRLSQLFDSVGNRVERKRLLIHSLKLWRRWRHDLGVAQVLGFLSDVNRLLGLRGEGMMQAKEAMEIYIRLNHKSGQSQSWQRLGSLLHDNNQLDVAEEAVSRALDLLLDEGDQLRACQCHRVLGQIYGSKGETEKAINHYETALGIASSFNWYFEQFWNHYNLALLFFRASKLEDANAHIGRAKSHAINDPYLLSQAMEVQAEVWFEERRFEDAKSAILGAADAFERIGAVKDVERSRANLLYIEREMENAVISGELPETVLPLTPVNVDSPLSARALPQTNPSTNE